MVNSYFTFIFLSFKHLVLVQQKYYTTVLIIQLFQDGVYILLGIFKKYINLVYVIFFSLFPLQCFRQIYCSLQKDVLIRTQSRRGMGRLAPNFQKNSPCEWILLYGEMHTTSPDYKGYFWQILLKISPGRPKSIWPLVLISVWYLSRIAVQNATQFWSICCTQFVKCSSFICHIDQYIE